MLPGHISLPLQCSSSAEVVSTATGIRFKDGRAALSEVKQDLELGGKARAWTKRDGIQRLGRRQMQTMRPWQPG
jgi:hypothetical protein